MINTPLNELSGKGETRWTPEDYEETLLNNPDMLILVARILLESPQVLMDRNTYRVSYIASELYDAERLSGPGVWSWKIARMVREKDEEALREVWAELNG